MVEIVETARAKINLALHVTGRRLDGYHLLESVITFAHAGDRLTVRKAAVDSFTMAGPFAGSLPEGSDNLVLRARDVWRKTLAVPDAVAIHLQKDLPVAAGIGGGSADAAACLRALTRLWDQPADHKQLAGIALDLGADVPMCIGSRPVFAAGIGERLDPIDRLPAFPMVLVNPRVEISTPHIFGQLHQRENPPIRMSDTTTLDGWVKDLRELRNDLQTPAEAVLPVIADICRTLIEHGAQLARMSGSGATCFGIFRDDAEALTAADKIRAAASQWFVVATGTTSSESKERRAT